MGSLSNGSDYREEKKSAEEQIKARKNEHSPRAEADEVVGWLKRWEMVYRVPPLYFWVISDNWYFEDYIWIIAVLTNWKLNRVEKINFH